MLRNMAMSLIESGRITTTLAKAKELRPYVEKIITKAIHHNLTSDRMKAVSLMRIIKKSIPDRRIQKILVRVWGMHFFERPGGYTRIIKLNRRLGDSAQMATIMMVLDVDLLKKYNQRIEDFNRCVQYLRTALMKNIPQPLDLIKLWKSNGTPDLSLEKLTRNEKGASFEINIRNHTDSDYWPVYSGKYVRYPFTVIIDSRGIPLKSRVEMDSSYVSEVPLFKDGSRLRFLYERTSTKQTIRVFLKKSKRSRKSNMTNVNLRISILGPLGLVSTTSTSNRINIISEKRRDN